MATTPAAGAPRRWPGALAVVAALGLAYVAVLLIGRAQETANVRILGAFDPVFLWIRESGGAASDWLERHVPWVAAALSAGVLLIVAGSLLATRRLPAGVLAPCAVLLLGIWGQALLLMDASYLGTAVYLLGVLAAVALGVWRPMRRLPGFPGLGAEPGAGCEGAWQPRWAVECALIVGVGLVALLCRTWALTELSDFLDLETVNSWVQSRTLEGVADYYRFTFLATNPGAAHMLPQWALFSLFGTSVFTLRMAAVLWGLAAVLLMYWLVRRLAGVAPAALAALLLATAPDQLFWSRSENGFFSPVPVLALATLHVCLWMAARWSFASVFWAAVLMPVSRYFYTTCLAMFLLPLAVAGHALLFVRGTWRKLWFVAPLLALGLVAWWYHLTVLLGVLNDGNYQFRHPAQIYGGTAWTRQGDFSQASTLDLLRLQAASMSEGLLRTVTDMTDLTTNSFGHWYMRVQQNPHATTMNVGLVVLLALGLGYLLGQVGDPRACMLLVWFVIALLPGVMSRDATPRRMSMLFPAAHVIGTLFLAAAVRTIRQAAGRRVADLASAAAAVALAIVLLSNTVSHFRMPLQPVIFADYLRFLRPLLRDSDAVFLNLPRPFISLLQLGEVDRFVAAPWCIEEVERDASWLRAGLQPHCGFTDDAYGLVFTQPEIDAARDAYRMRRISYVFFVEPTTRAQLDLIRGLYPSGAFHEYVSARDQRHLAVVTIDLADAVALRAPVLRSAASPPPDVLAEVAERAVTEGAPPAPAAVVEGGLWLDADGWYALAPQPPCPGAELRVDGAVAAADAPTPFLAGVHPFALSIPDPTACALPLRVTMARPDAPATPIGADRFTSPSVAALPAAAAPAVRTYPGYADVKLLAQLPGRSADLAIGPDGSLYHAILEQGVWRIRKSSPDGTPLATWDIGAPREMDPGTMSIAPDGTLAILFGRQVFLLGPDGRQAGVWDNVWFVWETEIAFWGNDRLIATIPHRDSLAVFNRAGELIDEVKSFAGGPGRFFSPTGIAFTPAGDFVVLQPDGRGLRFRTPADAFQANFVGDLRVGAAGPGAGFDGPDRLLVPSDGVIQVFDRDGTRLMASTPATDLSRLHVGRSARVRGAGDAVYVLDPEGNRLWRVKR